MPPDLPDPRTPQFAAKAAERIRQLLEITRGRAFVLFTSYALMHEVYERLLGELEFPMLLQGDAPKNALLEEFRTDAGRGAVRDVVVLAGRGRAGRATQLRDHRPTALRRAQRSGGRRAHQGDRCRGRQRLLPIPGAGAVISLKQGFGRLIRSLHDRGLLCLLDNRILKKAYGRVFLESLPAYRRTTDLREVESFFGA